MRKFRRDYFISHGHVLSDAQEAHDLREALMIALRKQELDRLRCLHAGALQHLSSYAPRGWFAAIISAPRELIDEVREALREIDRMWSEDEARCERQIRELLNAMRSDVWTAAALIERIEERYDADSIPGEAVARYRRECAS